MKKIGRIIPFIIYAILLIVPLLVWFSSPSYALLDSVDTTIALRLIFPLFGLLGFTVLWVQLMMGSFMPFWNKLYPPARVLRFHIVHGIVLWFVILLHPLLLYISKILAKGFSLETFRIDYVAQTSVPYVLLGIVSFILLSLVILVALLRKRGVFKKIWKWIHYLNYLVFVLVFVHSFRLGTHIESTNLKYLWFVYAVLFVIAFIYKRFYRPYQKAMAGPVVVRSKPQIPPQQPTNI